MFKNHKKSYTFFRKTDEETSESDRINADDKSYALIYLPLLTLQQTLRINRIASATRP